MARGGGERRRGPLPDATFHNLGYRRLAGSGATSGEGLTRAAPVEQPIADSPLRDPQERLDHDGPGQLGPSVFAFPEGDRDFAEAEPHPPRAIGHLDLEGVALRGDPV